ncbi:MAG: hypothetical protein KF831_10680 [Acidobacteria bacterium]|nr:hypothetical protein [Acidobacteriota bacterium]
MFNTRPAAFFLAILVFSFQAIAQTAVSSGTSGSAAGLRTPIIRLAEVREGMRGTARTVFRGTEPEDFNVEIIGVLPGGVGPKQDLIIGRLSGGGADRTAVFAGMSGSPVYVDGKLIGAISYSFPFSKEPICGITPIEQMVEIFEAKEPARRTSAPQAISFAEIASASLPELSYTVDTGLLAATTSTNPMMASIAGQTFRPIGVPLTFNGISQQTLDAFAPQLMRAGLVPVAAAGGTSPIAPMKAADENTLKPGASVSMQLTRGDYSLASSGTVTLREGDRIYAFGHPFLSLGVSDLPMSESSVVTVVPNVNNSFKLAVPSAMVGTMTQDRATGVFGKLGQAPKMIPVRLNIESSRGKRDTINFEMANDEFLTPLLLNIAIYNSLVAQERTVGETTVFMNGEIRFNGQMPVKIDRRFAGGQSAMLAAASIAAPVNAMLRSRFEDLAMSGIELDLKMIDGSRTASLERISVDRSEVRPGETVQITAYARATDGRIYTERIPVVIASDAPAGKLTILVGDGGAVLKTDAVQHFTPGSLGELIDGVNRTRTPDRLYVKVTRSSAGMIIGSAEMTNLPPSVLATLSSSRSSGGTKSHVETIVAEAIVPPSEMIIAGEQKLEIVVVR